jgi:hypothetical protein
VFRKNFEQLRRIPGNDVYYTAWEIASIEELIQVARNQWIGFGWNRDNCIAGGDGWQHEREKAEEWRVLRTNNANCPNRLVHRNRNVAERRIVYCAIELVCPSGVGKNALDAGVYFSGCLFFSYSTSQSARNFIVGIGSPPSSTKSARDCEL